MDYYKKKNLKFNSDVRREIRHAETVKARESSRFKRLSMLRCIDDEEQTEETSFVKPKGSACQEVKKPVSRLEVLRKWKHEKIVKRELEKKNSIRPFYAGAPSLKNTNQGTSKIGKYYPSSGNLSSISKKVPSCNSSLTSSIPNASKQASSCYSKQTSRIPNSSKQVSSCNYIQTLRIPNSSKQVSSSATLTSRIPNGSKLVVPVPKTTKITQPQLQRIPSSNKEITKKPTVFGNNPKTNQALPRTKIQTGISSPASSLSGLRSTKVFQSHISKPASVMPRRIPVQSKLPVTSNQKSSAALSKKLPSGLPVGVKLPVSSSCQKSAPELIKKPGLVSKVNVKKAPVTLEKQKRDKKTFLEPAENRNKETQEVKEKIPEDNVEPTCSPDCKLESGSEQNIDSLSEIFDCDVSIIKYKRAPSFAPENFTFQPPTEILDFSFDYSILRKIKEFTSRTSTPSKQRVKETKSFEEDENVIQEASENVEIETNLSTPSKQPAQISMNDKDNNEIIQTPSGNADVEKNISTPSKLHTQVYKSDKDDKEAMQEPSENEEIEANISSPSKQQAQAYKSDEDEKEIMHEMPKNVDIEAYISTSKQPSQGSKNIEDDNEIMQRSSESVKIDINISSPSDDPVQSSENSSPEISLQDSHSMHPLCHTITKDEEMLLKDWEKVAAEFDKNFELPLNKGVDRTKFRESILLNSFQIKRSILKKSTLNSIAEAEDFLVHSPDKSAENKENVFVSPRRSRRISKLISIDESPSTTPRRSLRLQMKLSKNIQLNDSNCKGSGHTNLTHDFDKLTLEDFDNMDPNDYLCDFDDSPEKIRSKKISLLYSPDKRKSIRRSIRGDLMSFSPIHSPHK